MVAAVASTLLSGFAQEKSPDSLLAGTTGPKNTVIATVPVGGGPFSLAASPDGSLIYVTSEASHSISAIDVGTNQVAFTIPIRGEPFYPAISPDGTTLYCTLISRNAILLISTATKQISQTFATGSSPQSVAVSPNGHLVYVPNYDGTITVIREGALRPPINVGGNPVYVAFTPDGSYAYVANQGFSGSGYWVNVIEVATRTPVLTISSGVPYPFGGMAVTPDRTNVYLCGINPSTSQPVAAVIDTATNTITDTILVSKYLRGPGQPAITPDGRYLYVPISIRGRFNKPGNHVVMVNLATNLRQGPAITVGNSPSAVAITPNGNYAYVSNYYDATVSVIDISPK